jgi:hypothetical protein
MRMMFKSPKRNKHTINTLTTVTVTNDANGIKVKLLGNVKGDFQLNKRTMCMQVFKRAYKQYRRYCRSTIARNIIETFKGTNSIQDKSSSALFKRN